MKLKIGQKWISKQCPYENFKIDGGTYDDMVLSDMDIPYDLPFEELPETAKIFFWKRTSEREFENFLDSHGKKNSDTTYPYAWCGDCKKEALVRKIKKYNMELAY